MSQGGQISIFHTTAVAFISGQGVRFLYLTLTKVPLPHLVACTFGSIIDHDYRLSMVLRARHPPAVFDQASRLLIQTDLANIDRVEPPWQDRDPGLGTPTAADTFATVRQRVDALPLSAAPQFRSPILFSGATSTGDRCSVSWLAVEIGVHVATVLLAQQGFSLTACQSGVGYYP